mmetsp:Transcript_106582/g.208981  ORF Transcript_106582/g.208981 Transcript_106582/m.208981 type:complete len:739 (-) Transcript_106582:162-2378(-)|eukprot:CAMPEP_0170408088 /NCGR_PEP_ID=MMETSP0117_2-20130122/28603_1 /TAXON_ID=400756 /ORGANISM="Durinskia baltica, Strain CSIRO CS-38" /LENGTH=738 /DNA_ID=CAMNT_0010665397 /DNA_START=91 /DNA_END=2307 /DNA_ORIENTATION=-
MSAPKSRGWEKRTPVPASASQSPAAQLTSFVEGLSEEDRASHRSAYLHLMQSMVGSNVSVGVAGAKELTGVFHSATPFEQKPHVLVVKASRLLQDGKPVANGASDGKTAVLKFADISSVTTTGKLDLVTKTVSSEFQTDTAIKKHGDMSHLSGRNLQSIDSSWLDTKGDMSLEGKSGKNWDQFEANKRLFNVKDTYDENLYTKRLDLKSMTAEQIARADRLAREIEGSASTNIHLQEERGQVTEGDWDEEDRFSGVLRTDDKKSAKPSADTDMAWRRGGKAGQQGGSDSGTASPLTTSASKVRPSSGASKSVSPPPGVTMPSAGQATNNHSPKKATATTSSAAAVATESTTPVAAAAPVQAATDTTTATTATSAATAATKLNSATEAATTVLPSETTTTATASATAPAASSASKPLTVPKLRASAAEFTPSWLKEPAATTAPAVPVTPSTPTIPPVQQFIPPQYAQNIPYGMPMSPEVTMPMYQNKVHGSPGPHVMVTPSNMPPMHDMPPPYYDANQMNMHAQGFSPGMEFVGGQPPANQGYAMYPPHGQPMAMGNMGMPMPMGVQGGGMPIEFNAGMMNGMNGMPPVMMYPTGAQPAGEYFPHAHMPMMHMSPGGQPMMQQQGYGGGYPPAGAPMYNQQQHQMGGMGVMGGGFQQNGGASNMGSGQKQGMRGGPNKGGRGGNVGMKSGYQQQQGGNRGGGHPSSNNAMANSGPGTPMASGSLDNSNNNSNADGAREG